MASIPGTSGLGKVTVFTSNFSPYRKRYIHRQGERDLFGSSWTTCAHYLADDQLEAAIEGRILLGYFLATTPRAFALDIDAHGGGGDGYLLAVYRDVKARLGGMAPSVLNRSPRGLHPHYLLTYPVPQSILIARIEDRLSGLPVEIRPTSNLGLRIPTEGTLLDPSTFMPLRKSFQEAIDEAERYHPAILLGDDVLPAQVRDSLRERKALYARVRGATIISRAESAHQYIFPGETNVSLCALVPLYRQHGLTAEEAAARFSTLLAPVYDGELRSWPRLLRRVEAFYSDRSPTPYEGGRVPRGLFDEKIARAVADSWNPPALNKQAKGAIVKRRRTLESFTLELIQWRGYVNTVKGSPAEIAAWDYLYPFFRKNTGEGYYPIPRNLLMKLNSHYHRLMPHLLDTGFLNASPYQYSADGGICRYYKINDGDFI